ncbi:hypothetical protein HPB47_022765 [Ixodes persulcatus]|uniref:Uncharacterized protein n=1 Tax=Ixodes persulcatus TaxID=34615 RepID=A0AC60QC59_IXOPE|nr:hypothetical protein HPB47_022765 [Ixodes persulcatus]
MTINELPPDLRCKNLTILMLWYGQSHPDMTLVLQAFAKQMYLLTKTGVEWTCDGETFISKTFAIPPGHSPYLPPGSFVFRYPPAPYQVYCVCCSADSPSRALMQNMVQYTGYYGCGWYLHPGKTVEGTVKYPVGSASVPDRTKEGVERNMAEAFETGTHVQGVMGPSALINVAGFDIVWSFVPDYMHCVLLGVTRQSLELWLSNVGAAYYIESPQLLKEIDERLCHIKFPQCMARLPRSVLLRKFWKATEWQQWLLYLSLVVRPDLCGRTHATLSLLPACGPQRQQ